MNRDAAVDQVRQFLTLFPLDEWWPGLNPSFKPISATKPRGLYMLVRISCPALGDSRDAIVAEVVRIAGYDVIPLDGGYTFEKRLTPPPQSGDGPRERGAFAAATASA